MSTLKKKSKKEEIAAILVLPRSMRVQVLLDYVEIKQCQIVDRYKKDITCGTVSLLVAGKGRSIPTSQKIYSFFKERLGDLCPDFDVIFADDPVIDQCANH